VPIEAYTPLYERYRTPSTMRRVFVDPEHRVEARAILKGLADDVDHAMDTASVLEEAGARSAR
jgi:hypothetical protein